MKPYQTPVAKQRRATENDVQTARIVDDLTVQIRAVAEALPRLKIVKTKAKP